MRYLLGIYRTYRSGRHIHFIYHVYTMYIPCISYFIHIIYIQTLHLTLVYFMYIPCIYIYYILVYTIDIACTSSLQGFVALIGHQHRPIMAWKTTGQMFMMKLILIHKQCWKDLCPYVQAGGCWVPGTIWSPRQSSRPFKLYHCQNYDCSGGERKWSDTGSWCKNTARF